MVEDHAGHHRLAHRHGADADAGVVAALGDDLGVVAGVVDGAPWRQDGGCRLDGKAADDGLTAGNPAKNTAGPTIASSGKSRSIVIRRRANSGASASASARAMAARSARPGGA